MQDNRKDYRKKFTSKGVMYLAGELLEFVSYDVSVKGIQIELKPGRFINSVQDLRDLLTETQEAEVFVQSLGLSAGTKLAWVLEDEGKILVGLEFVDVRHNAEKLWVKRRHYRKSLSMQARFIFNNQEFNAQTVNISTDGMKLTSSTVDGIQVGDAIKLFVDEKGIKALAVVIWMNSSASTAEFGVRYINVN